MSRSLLDDAFAHQVWATLRLMDTCLSPTPEQLNAAVPEPPGIDVWDFGVQAGRVVDVPPMS